MLNNTDNNNNAAPNNNADATLVSPAPTTLHGIVNAAPTLVTPRLLLHYTTLSCLRLKKVMECNRIHGRRTTFPRCYKAPPPVQAFRLSPFSSAVPLAAESLLVATPNA
jgi:hypothetical protein